MFVWHDINIIDYEGDWPIPILLPIELEIDAN